VDGRHYKIEFLQQIVRKIERSVREDIRFCPFEELKAFPGAIELVDFPDLFGFIGYFKETPGDRRLSALIQRRGF